MTDKRPSEIIYSLTEYQHWARTFTRSAENQARVEVSNQCVGEVSDPMYAGDCPRCGWPHGRKGFLRADCLPGEWGFGKLFACSECWPPPLGNRQGSVALTAGEREQLDMCRARVALLGKPPQEPKSKRGEAWVTVTARGQ